MVVDNEYVVVAAGRRDKELSRKVAVDLPGDRLAGGIDVVFTKGGRCGGRRRERGGRGGGNGREFRLGGSEVFALLGKVTHVSDDGFGEVVFDDGGSDARPGSEVARLDGLEPRRWDGKTGGAMEEGDTITGGALGQGGEVGNSRKG